MTGEPRRSSRASRPPDKYTPLPSQSQPDRPLVSVETLTIKQEESGPESQLDIQHESEEEDTSNPNTGTMSFTMEDMNNAIAEALAKAATENQKAISKAVADALATARPSDSRCSDSPSLEREGSRNPEAAKDRQSRALTADLVPPIDYYLPVLRSGIPAVDPSKVKYPKIFFSDHKGPIQYEAWKMDMKLCIQKFSGNFANDEDQVHAYFQCSAGEAKTLILQHMDPSYEGDFNCAAHVLKALDQRFHDYNQVQEARTMYNELKMGSMSYQDFRTKFSHLAVTGRIARSRWFDELCEKVSPQLKRYIVTERFRMNNDYTTLDEFLAVTDRGLRNIEKEDQAATYRKSSVSFASGSTPRGVLKNKDYQPSTSPLSSRSSSPVGRPPTPIKIAGRSSPAPADGIVCYHCHQSGHKLPDCPERRKQSQTEKGIGEMVTGKEMDSDKLAGNS